jgi:hypothetical protein
VPIPMVKCEKHGLCRAQVFYVCKECASENVVATPSASNNTQSHAISLCLGCIKEPCSQRSELPSCPVTICAMRQAKHAGV